MKSKCIKAVHNLKPNKSAEIQAELWKFSEEEIKNILFKIIKK